MKVSKPTFKDKTTGKRKKCRYWYATFTDNRQIRYDTRTSEVVGVPAAEAEK